MMQVCSQQLRHHNGYMHLSARDAIGSNGNASRLARSSVEAIDPTGRETSLIVGQLHIDAGALAFFLYALLCVYLMATKHVRAAPAAIVALLAWGLGAWTFGAVLKVM
jgi:hypothetical protein